MPYGVLTVSVGIALQGVDTPPLSGGLTQRNPRIKTSQTPQLRKRFHSPTFLPNHKVGNFSGKKRGSGSRRGPTGSLVRRQTNSKRGVGFRYRKLGSSIQAHMPGGVNMSGFPLPLSAMLGGGCWSLHYREPLQRITGSEDHAHPSAVGCWGWGGGGLSDDDGSGDDGRQALGIACQIDCSLASPPNGPVWMSQV